MATPSLLYAVDKISFYHTAQNLSPRDAELLEAWWQAYQYGNPHLFNGRIIACHSHHWASEGLQVEWYWTSYSHYAVRRRDAHQVVKPAGTIYCSIILMSTEGRVAVGQMSRTTFSADKLQLPGGNVGVAEGVDLTLAACAEAAGVELDEEVGFRLRPGQLNLWRVLINSNYNDVGLIFLCETSLSQAALDDVFARHLEALRQRGEPPEFTNLYHLGSDGLGACRPLQQGEEDLQLILSELERTSSKAMLPG